MDYTKGEWKLELRPADNVYRIRTDNDIIADVFGINGEDKASAHLIAAAPELYEALRKAHDALDFINGKWGTKQELCLFCHSDKYDASGIVHRVKCPIAESRKALAKAEGK